MCSRNEEVTVKRQTLQIGAKCYIIVRNDVPHAHAAVNTMNEK